MEEELELFFDRSVCTSGIGVTVENFPVHFLREIELGFCKVVGGNVCDLWGLDHAGPDA